MANFFSILKLAKPYLELTFLDSFSVKRFTPVQNPDNPATTKLELAEVEELTDLPCKMNFVEQLLRQDSPENALYDINPIGASIMVYTKPNFPVKKGDTVVISKRDETGKVLATYEGIIGLPDVNISFQWFMVRQEGEA